MAASMVSLWLRLARMGWHLFVADVTDGTYTTETELLDVDNSKSLGTYIGEAGDEILEVIMASEHYVGYTIFMDGLNSVGMLPGLKSQLIGPAGSEVSAGGSLHLKVGLDFSAPIKLTSKMIVKANTAVAGLQA